MIKLVHNQKEFQINELYFFVKFSCSARLNILLELLIKIGVFIRVCDRILTYNVLVRRLAGPFIFELKIMKIAIERLWKIVIVTLKLKLGIFTTRLNIEIFVYVEWFMYNLNRYSSRANIVCDKQTDFVGKYLENHTLQCGV